MRLITALFACLTTLGAWGQDSGGTVDGLDDRLEQLLAFAQGRPEELDRLGREILAHPGTNSSCDSLLVGYVLQLAAYNLEPNGREAPTWDSIRCAYRGARMFLEEGTRCFIARDFAEARKWYHRALDATQDAKRRVSIMQSIGTCHYQEEDLENALKWYAASTQHGVELLSAISLSNLANAHLALGQPEECWRWGDLAEKKLLQELNEGLNPDEFLLRRDLILGNLCLAALELGRLDDAESTFQRIGLKEVLPGLGPEFFHTAWVISWRLNDPYLLAKHESQWSRVLLEDSIGSVKRFGAALCTIEPWRSLCMETGESAEMGEVWALLRELPMEQLPALDLSLVPVEARSTDWRTGVAWHWMGGLWLLFGLGVWGAKWMQNRRRHWTLPGALGSIEAGFYASEKKVRREGRAGLAYVVQKLRLGKWVQHLTSLNPRELAVFFAIAIGERPKDTANRMGISTKTVYMVRTDLRKKLGLEAEAPLETWLSDRWSMASTPIQSKLELLPLLSAPTPLFQKLTESLEPIPGGYAPGEFVALPSADLNGFYAAMAALSLGNLAVGAFAIRYFGARRRMKPFQVLDAYLQSPTEDAHAAEALAQFQLLEFLVGMQDTATRRRAGTWNVLTSAERAVVQGILADKTVQEMAKDLACTTSHVYNLRASIRRKWGLDSEQPIRVAIKQRLEEA